VTPWDDLDPIEQMDEDRGFVALYGNTGKEVPADVVELLHGTGHGRQAWEEWRNVARGSDVGAVGREGGKGSVEVGENSASKRRGLMSQVVLSEGSFHLRVTPGSDCGRNGLCAVRGSLTFASSDNSTDTDAVGIAAANASEPITLEVLGFLYPADAEEEDTQGSEGNQGEFSLQGGGDFMD